MFDTLIKQVSNILKFDFEKECLIEIRVGEFDTAKCSGIDAGCFVSGERSFVIMIQQDAPRELVVHELIHVWQICIKRLQIKRNVWHWLGEPYTTIPPHLMQHDDYLNLPWEREARTMTEKICQLLDFRKT